MQAERKTVGGEWMGTSVDYILRTARGQQVRIGGTDEVPVLAGVDSKDDDIISAVKAAGQGGFVLGGVTVRIINN